MEEIIKRLESLRDICDAKSNMAIGKGKIAWAGYANTADDALALLKKQPQIVRCKDCKWRGHEDDSPKWIPCLAIRTNNDWFCADGEIKESR